MHHVKLYLFVLICCFIPVTASAENKKISISCDELTSIDIEQPPPGYIFPGEACGDKCFYTAFTMKDTTALRVNAEFNANKDDWRELYIGEYRLLLMEPFHLNLPYSQKISTTTVYPTLEGALNEARRICPDTAINVPKMIH